MTPSTKTSAAQKQGFPLSWAENIRRNREQLSKRQPVSLEEARAQVQRLKEGSQSTVKKGQATS